MKITFLNKILPKHVLQQLRLGKRMLRVAISDFHKAPPIFVYAMPKSGTSTIWMTLRNVTPRKIYKLHKLSDGGLKLSREKRALRSRQSLIDIDSLSFLVRDKIDSTADVCWEVITSTRDPISQAISELFQGIDVQHPELLTGQGDVDSDKAIQFLQDKLSSFDEFQNPERTWYSMVWFDWELKSLFDIDVYSQPYNHDQGYMIIENHKAKVLLTRLEDLNRSLQSALSDFLGIHDSIEIQKANLGSKKEYREDQAFYDAYRHVKSHLKVPRDVCEKIYSTKYTCHFYTHEERMQFIQKWSA